MPGRNIGNAFVCTVLLMLLTRLFLLLWGVYGLVYGGRRPDTPPQLRDDFYRREIDIVAQFKSRLTGSESHTKFVDYLEGELDALGLEVFSDHFEFEYNTPPSSPLSLVVDGKSLSPSMYVPYSGNTGSDGVTGSLVRVAVPDSVSASPNWTAAAGKIAWLDILNPPVDGAKALPVWPGSQTWGQYAGIPATNPGVRNLTAAAAAGVKGVIYNWVNTSSLNVLGQYGPFKINYQGIPSIYVTNQALEHVQAHEGSVCTIVSTGKLTQNVKTRTVYTIIQGTDLKHESVIISTHSDGTNAVEENGHIGLLAKARELAASKPRRTTILVFVTGHLHTSGFTDIGRVMERWLQLHPTLWAGNTTSSLKAVFGSCVEHLGALHWREDAPNNLYYPTGAVQDEILYAATEELATLLERVWQGAEPGVLRVINPNISPAEQSGEGLPLLWNNIPEISLCTAPDWLLKVWPTDFDERQLMDTQAVKRQVESFLRVWRAVDGMTAKELGTLNYSRVPPGL